MLEKLSGAEGRGEGHIDSLTSRSRLRNVSLDGKSN